MTGVNHLALTHQTAEPKQGTAPYPGLLLLHGLGSNEFDLLGLAPHLDSGTFVVSARAPFPYFGGYMWYDFEREGVGLGGPKIERSLDLLRQFLGEIVRAYPVDAERLYVGGFSQGAAMAGALGMLHPEEVAGVIMASGYLPPDPVSRYRTAEAAGHPVFIGHGTRDGVVPIEAARRTREYFLGTPVALTYREYPIAHEVSMEELGDMAAWLAAALTTTPGAIRPPA